MNIVIVIGTVLEDATPRVSANGKEHIILKVVVTRANNEGKKIKEIIETHFWDKSVKYITEYVHKGDVVSIEGCLTPSSDGYLVNARKITKLRNSYF